MADMSGCVFLALDFQRDIVAMSVAGGSHDAVARARVAIDAARTADIPVIFVRVAFRDGHPEVAASNKRMSMLKERGMLLDSGDGAALIPEIGARPGDPVVTKRRFGAFAHTELAALLSAFDARTLVIAGLSTSGVVLSTIRHAADIDFRMIVLKDACADGDPQLHEVLTTKVFPIQCDVMTVDEFVSSLP